MAGYDIATLRESALDDHLERLDLIVTEYLKGKAPQEIAKELQLSPAIVSGALREWRTMASNSEAIKSRALQALSNADRHYDKLIKEAYRILVDAEAAGALGQRVSSLKIIADMEAKRIELLQKAGMLEDSDVAKRNAEMERKQKVLISILQETVGTCKVCRPKVMSRLSEVVDGIVTVEA
jgi:hypothetical protein